MCRWIAYRGDPIPLECYVTEPSHSLVKQSFNALESAGSTNGDGFGLGWYGDQLEPGWSGIGHIDHRRHPGRARDLVQYGQPGQQERAPAINGRPDGWPRPRRLPLRGERLGELALLPLGQRRPGDPPRAA